MAPFRELPPSFTVTGPHTWTSAGSYTITYEITATDGSSVIGAVTATVADAGWVDTEEPLGPRDNQRPIPDDALALAVEQSMVGVDETSWLDGVVDTTDKDVVFATLAGDEAWSETFDGSSTDSDVGEMAFAGALVDDLFTDL
jgi:hypothetical protein